MPVMREFFGLLGDIIGLFVVDDTFSGDTGGMLDWITTVREDVIPVLDNFLTSIRESGLPGAIGDLALAFIGLLNTITESGIVPTFFDSMATALEGLAAILENEVFATSAVILAGLFGTLVIAEKVASPLLGLVAGIQGLAAAFSTLFLTTVGEGAAATVVLSTFGTVALVFIGVVAALAAAALLAYIIFRNWDTITRVVGDVSLAVQDFVQNFDLSEALQSVDQFATDFMESLNGIADSLDFTALQENITGFGDLAAPMVSDFAAKFAEGLIAFFEEAPQMFVDGISTLMEELPGIFDTVFTGFITLLGTLAPKIAKTLGTLMGTGLRLYITGLVKLISNIPNILQAMGKAFETIMKAIPGIVAKYLWMIVRLFWTILRNAPRFVLIVLNTFAQFILGFLEGLFPGITEKLGNIVDGIVEWFGNLFDGIMDPIEEFVDDIIAFFEYLFEFLIGHSLIPDLINGIIDWFLSLPTKVLETIQGFVEDLIGFFSELPTKILAAVEALSQTIIDLGGKIIGWIVSGLVTLATTLWDWFTALPQAIVNLLTTAAQTVIDIGGKIIGWIVEGLIAIAQTLWDWFTALPTAVFDLVVAANSAIIDIGEDIIDWIIQGITTTVQTLWDWFSGMPAKAWNAVVGASSMLVAIGKDAIRWIIDGINAMWNTLYSWFTGLPLKLWNAVSTSASKIIDIGEDIIDWVLDGIDNGWDSLYSWFTGLPLKLWNAVSSASGKVVDIGESIVDWIIDGLSDLGSKLKDKIISMIPGGGWINDQLGSAVNTAKAGWDAGYEAVFGAMGGVFNAPTRMIIGEAGAEALIPLTRPTRAMALMQQSGLDKLVMSSMVMAPTGTTGTSEVGSTRSLVHIENATFVEPTDIDVLIAEIRLAYSVMGGKT